MFLNLLKDAKITKLKGRAAAGTTTQTPAAALDMSGYDSVAIIASTGDATSGTVLELKVYGVATNAVSGGTELTSSSATVTSASATDADDKLLIVDIHHPQYRYIYCSLTIATQNCESDGLYAVQYNSHARPVTQWTGVVASATFDKSAA